MMKHTIKSILAKFSQQTLAVTAMAACTAAGYLLHDFSRQVRFDEAAAGFLGSAGSSLSSVFAMPPMVAMLILPALFVAACALGGLYLWNQGGK